VRYNIWINTLNGSWTYPHTWKYISYIACTHAYMHTQILIYCVLIHVFFYNMRVYLKFLFRRNYVLLINILCCILLGKLIKSWWKKALEAGTCLTTADRSCSCRPSNVTVKLMMLAWMYTAGRKWGFDIDVVIYSLKYKGSLQVGCQTLKHFMCVHHSAEFRKWLSISFILSWVCDTQDYQFVSYTLTYS